jgi:hypothetical protein
MDETQTKPRMKGKSSYTRGAGGRAHLVSIRHAGFKQQHTGSECRISEQSVTEESRTGAIAAKGRKGRKKERISTNCQLTAKEGGFNPGKAY